MIVLLEVYHKIHVCARHFKWLLYILTKTFLNDIFSAFSCNKGDSERPRTYFVFNSKILGIIRSIKLMGKIEFFYEAFQQLLFNSVIPTINSQPSKRLSAVEVETSGCGWMKTCITAAVIPVPHTTTFSCPRAKTSCAVDWKRGRSCDPLPHPTSPHPPKGTIHLWPCLVVETSHWADVKALELTATLITWYHWIGGKDKHKLK